MLILKASPIHGVGVFTTTAIRSGQRIPLFAVEDWRLRQKVTGYKRRYSVKAPDGWHGPANFHRMSIGWYTNHSTRPNVVMDGMFATATRHIKAGTELTLDYDKL